MSDEVHDRSIDAKSLRVAFHAVVRGFGLLDSGRTPCGQPISVSHAHALIELLHRPDSMQGDLGHALGLSKSAVSRMAAGLEKRGWIERRPDDEDGRVRRLRLTPRGRRLAKRVDSTSIDRFAAMLEGIPVDLRAQAVSMLEVLHQALPVPADVKVDNVDGE